MSQIDTNATLPSTSESSDSFSPLDAAMNSGIWGFVSRNIERAGVKADPNFVLTDDAVKKYGTGLPIEYWDSFADAGSEEEMGLIREQMFSLYASKRKVESAGVTGWAASMLADLVDPASVAIGFATGGMGWIGKGGRVARMAKAGLLAAGTTVPVTAYVAREDPERDWRDVAYSAAGAFTLGAVGHGVGEAFSKWANMTRRGIEYTDAVDSGLTMTPKGQKFFEEEIRMSTPEWTSQANADIVRSEMAMTGDAPVVSTSGDIPAPANAANVENVDSDLPALHDFVTSGHDITVYTPPSHTAPPVGPSIVTVPQGPAATTGGGGGAGGGNAGNIGGGGQNALPPPPNTGLGTVVRKPNDYYAVPTDTMAAMTQLRFGLAGRLGASPIQSVREASSLYVQDWLIRKGGAPAPDAGASWAGRNHRVVFGGLRRDMQPHIDAYMQRTGVPWWRRPFEERNLAKSVSAYIENPGRVASYVPPEVAELAKLHIQRYAELGEQAKRMGVPGFENFTADPNYFPHMWNTGAIYDKVDGWGFANVASLYEKGMVAYGWDAAKAKKAAPGFLRALMEMGQHSDVEKAGMFGANHAVMRSVLRKNVTGITEDEIQDVINMMTPNATATTPRAMSRTGLDTLVSIDRVGSNGKVEKLWLHNLLETDANAVFEKYSRQMHGAMAEAEILRAMSLRADPTGKIKFTQWDDLRQHIIDKHVEAGVRTDIGAGLRTMQRLDLVRKATVGIPLSQSSALNDFLRLVRSFNFIRIGPGFGLAQLNEFGKVAGEFGVDFLRAWPQMRSLFRRGQTGQLDDPLLSELEEVVGAGMDRMSHQAISRFDDQAGVDELAGGAITRAMHRGERLAGDMSGMMAVTTAQQRMAAASASHRLLRAAIDASPLSSTRLADIGIDGPMWGRISSQVKQHSSIERGISGRRLRTWNFDQWTDTEAAARVISSLDRWSRKAVQDSDLGAQLGLATTPVGRMVMQFRSYVTQAWEKQFLRGVQLRDRQTFMSWFLSGTFGSLVYMGQKYLAASTDSEAAKKLDKDLSPGNVALQGFARAGASSLLPTIVDSAIAPFGVDPIFNSRYSQLSSKGLMSNPTFALVDDVGSTMSGLGHLISGKGVIRSEAKSMTNLVPYSGALGVRQGLNALVDEVPKVRGRVKW